MRRQVSVDIYYIFKPVRIMSHPCMTFCPGTHPTLGRSWWRAMKILVILIRQFRIPEAGGKEERMQEGWREVKGEEDGEIALCASKSK